MQQLQRNIAALLRKKLTTRQLRYILGALVLSRIPFLRRYYSVYARYVYLPQFGAELLTRQELSTTIDLSDLGEDYLAWYHSAQGLPPMRDGRVELKLGFMAHLLGDCVILPRSKTILHYPSERIVLCPGRETKRNRVRPVHYRETETIPGVSISMVSGMHYYHFFFDQLLLLLHILTEVQTARTATILIGENMLPFQHAGYEILRQEFPGLRFRTVKNNVKVHCEKLIAACHTRDEHMINWFAPGPLIRHLGKSYRDHYRIQPRASHRLLFISRRNQKLRQLINEDALYEQLSPLGFELVTPETLPHSEQVGLFSSARMVIGCSGAALTNLLFCQAGTTVIELCPGAFYKPFWVGLSKQMGLNHHVITSDDLKSHDHFSVDTGRVIDIVQRVIGPKSEPAGFYT